MPSPQTGGADPVLLLPDELEWAVVVLSSIDDVSGSCVEAAELSLALELVLVLDDVSRPLSLLPVLDGQSVTPRSAMSASMSSTTQPEVSKITQTLAENERVMR